jgi:hypothetical protein
MGEDMKKTVVVLIIVMVLAFVGSSAVFAWTNYPHFPQTYASEGQSQMIVREISTGNIWGMVCNGNIYINSTTGYGTTGPSRTLNYTGGVWNNQGYNTAPSTGRIGNPNNFTILESTVPIYTNSSCTIVAFQANYNYFSTFQGNSLTISLPMDYYTDNSWIYSIW